MQDRIHWLMLIIFVWITTVCGVQHGGEEVQHRVFGQNKHRTALIALGYMSAGVASLLLTQVLIADRGVTEHDSLIALVADLGGVVAGYVTCAASGIFFGESVCTLIRSSSFYKEYGQQDELVQTARCTKD